MKLLWTSCLALCAVLFSMPSIDAQINCEYTLKLFDIGGSGLGDTWDGARLRVQTNETVNIYSIVTSNVAELSIPLLMSEGDSLILTFVSGRFDNEISIELHNGTQDTILRVQSPQEGRIYADAISCPACPDFSLSQVKLFDVFDTRAILNWTPSDEAGQTWLEYGKQGFAQGIQRITAEAEIELMNLEQNTIYEVYFASLCSNGDTSLWVGPYTFQTIYTHNLGVVDISMPMTGCDLSSELMEITLKNFGARAQTLFPYRFSINGNVASVSQPIDGYFTGVLGKDSTFVVEFDARAELAEPGIYTISAWTELEKESDFSNDTTTIEIINVPFIQEYPYYVDFEDWQEGWRSTDDSANSSWEYGRPDTLGFMQAASGNFAWGTNIQGPYNNFEDSYLQSACFDFSQLTEDPIISFSFFMQSEGCCDEAWLELSIDGGETWAKIQADSIRNLNWYNDVFNEWWDGSGGFDGWNIASSTLAGAAGVADAAVRFVMSSDATMARIGVGIDDVYIGSLQTTDFALFALEHDAEECGSPRDAVSLSIANLGATAQENIELSYQVNGGAVVTEMLPDSLAATTTTTYTFDVPFNSSEFGNYEITAWLSHPDDQFFLNDTVNIQFSTIIEPAFRQDFERGFIPANWQVESSFSSVTLDRDAPSHVLSANMNPFAPFFSVFTPIVGPIEAGDSLLFDYRLVEIAFQSGEVLTLPHTLGENNQFVIRISTDCGENYEEIFQIDEQTHFPSLDLRTIRLGLDNYIGEAIKVQFFMVWGSDDYFIDLDNISIKRCPTSLQLSAATEAIPEDGEFGTARVRAKKGFAPYTYLWSNGDTTVMADSLSSGVHIVTVTDVLGCTDSLAVTIGLASDLEEIDQLEQLRLFPNPTDGTAQLQLEFATPTDVQIQIFNAMGQRVKELPFQKIQSESYTLDLQNQADGMYFVRIWAAGVIHTERLLLMRQ